MGCFVILLVVVLLGLLTGAAGAQGFLWALFVLLTIVGLCVVSYRRSLRSRSRGAHRND